MGKLYCLLVLLQIFLVNRLTAENIPTVILTRQTGIKGPGFIVSWKPVETKNRTDPIIGYKVKVWSAPCINETVYKYVNDEYVKEITTHRKKIIEDEIIYEKPDYVCIASANESNCTIPLIKIDVSHHYRALAFTKTAEGPLSYNPSQFKFSPSNESERDNACNSTIQIPVAEFDRDSFY